MQVSAHNAMFIYSEKLGYQAACPSGDWQTCDPTRFFTLILCVVPAMDWHLFLLPAESCTVWCGFICTTNNWASSLAKVHFIYFSFLKPGKHAHSLWYCHILPELQSCERLLWNLCIILSNSCVPQLQDRRFQVKYILLFHLNITNKFMDNPFVALSNVCLEDSNMAFDCHL